jgi:hypothetical protein
MGSDLTVKRIDEMEWIWGGSFVRARAWLGASSFGMNVLNLPPNYNQCFVHSDPTPTSKGGRHVHSHA